VGNAVSNEEFKIVEIWRLDRVLGSPTTIGIGNLGGDDHSGTKKRIVKCVSDASRVGDVTSIEDAVSFASALGNRESLAIPLVATILRLSEEAHIELGDTLVICSDCSLGRLMGEMGKWWAPDRVNLGSEASPEPPTPYFSHQFRVSDENVQDQLGQLLSESKNVTFVDFSGSPDVWNVMLQAAPYWSRIVASALAEIPMTIDFYNNIHRKGVTIYGLPMTAQHLFLRSRAVYEERHLRKAETILSIPDDASRILASLESQISAAKEP
jgi:hypothetical protein